MNSKEKLERLNCIVKMRRGGATYAEIAKEFNLSVERVRQIIQKYNESARNPLVNCNHVRPPDPEVTKRREKVAELCRAGKTYKDICTALGISISVATQDLRVYNELHQEKLKPKSIFYAHLDVAERRKKIMELCNLGLSRKEIAKRLKISENLVLQDIFINRQGNIMSSNTQLHDYIDEADKKEIVKLKKQGMSILDIANKYDVNTGRICIILKEFGCK
ncbi:MAG: helix-turn-helix domain-containing protein [Planctomycetaceae bacterium]|jgi:DNA-binding NarL/FixJ family response regulator|nr:helix-turn-helix domain-containing protein [Planctomycetaceae bacterium]